VESSNPPAPDEVCKVRLLARNAAGTHDFAASEAEFEEITHYFQAPSAEEGFTTIVYALERQ
jgi:hypothetical protein